MTPETRQPTRRELMITRLAQARRDADEWLEKAADKQVDQLLVHVNWMKLFSDLLRDAADLLCEEGEPRTLNINDHVWVRLREKGKAMLREQDARWSQLYATTYGRLPVAERQEAENGGWSRWQLWGLIEVFGPALYLGTNLPFETTIRLEQVGASPRDPVPPPPHQDEQKDEDATRRP